MSKKYFQTFVVTPAFEFPIDMLWYDACFPCSAQDSGKIYRSIVEHERGLEIQIGRLVGSKADKPTVDRWLSFNCNVSDIKIHW